MKKYKKERLRTFAEEYSNMYPDTEKKIKEITFQVTEDCCLKCTYCYQTNKSRNKMTFDVAKKFIDALLNDEYDIATIKNTAGIGVEFIGGEPLMEVDLITNIIEYLLSRMIELDHPWLYYTRFSIPSNGVLVESDKVIEFFDKYNTVCHLGISIDGNKALHDSCRIDFNNNGSYDRAISAVHFYKNRYGIMPSTKMTLAPQNVHYTKDAVLNLINEGYEDIALNCAFEKGWELDHARILYDQLKELADYIIENDLYDRVYISMFEENLFCPIGEDENDNWCGGVKDKMLAIDYKGDMHPCIRYMDSSLNGKQPPIIIGNIDRGYIASESDRLNIEKITNITRRSQSTDECYYCHIAKGCAWCSAHNYQETGSVNCRLTYICIMHKARALANVYYWNKLYQYLGIDKKFINYVDNRDIDSIIIPKEDNDNGKQFIQFFKIN